MLLDHLSEITDNQHYLVKTSIHYDEYLHALNKILNSLQAKIGEKPVKRLIRDKLQVRAGAFNESQYIQAACELTAMSEFIDYPNAAFVYEDKVTSPKDVDFSVTVKGEKYNLEVKCASYKDEVCSPDEVTLTFSNRMPHNALREQALKDARECLTPQGKTVKEGKNLDNVMKDFLESTQAKVKQCRVEDTNILIVCCHKEIDMQLWRGYLFGEGGFFTEDSPIGHERFDLVDFVLLTNIYNRHFNYFNDLRVSNHWRLSSSFNLLYPNRFSKKSKSITVENGRKKLNELNEIFPNHNVKFEEFLKNRDDVPSGEKEAIKHILGVAWYADKFKNNGIFYFQQS
ncbi:MULTISPECIES: hypothetical protein [unclassified Pseudomonas]|uniref:hypothetical protein n=1 Tax=unclassified Pseudomonas TaxID=196821 RepID=UPI000CD09C53|nr:MULTISPECIES: hypothetical protein [unclassified Pseudomonas]POA13705.1 hypothetical protein C1892_14465 [Pseudomonas sp. MPBD7-1]